MGIGRIILPRSTEVVIASFGGVGTTFLLNFLSQYKKTNRPNDADGIKHSPLPPISLNRKVKFVYIYGNPQQAAISLFRRNFHYYQSIKLQKWFNNTISPIPKEMTVKEYASEGIDKFHFRNHFYNWYDKYLSACQTMFIKYETIFENLLILLEFLEMPNYIDKFPPPQKRTIRVSEIPVETLSQLNNMYGDFADELAKLDEVEIRKSGNHRIFAMAYLKRPYLKAFTEHCVFEALNPLKRHSPKIYQILRKMKSSKNK